MNKNKTKKNKKEGGREVSTHIVAKQKYLVYTIKYAFLSVIRDECQWYKSVIFVSSLWEAYACKYFTGRQSELIKKILMMEILLIQVWKTQHLLHKQIKDFSTLHNFITKQTTQLGFHTFLSHPIACYGDV